MKQSKKPGRLTLALLILLALVLVLLLAGWFTYRHYIAKLNYQERDAVSAVSSETPPPLVDETASEEQRRQAEEIEGLHQEISGCFARAYRYLAAAKTGPDQTEPGRQIAVKVIEIPANDSDLDRAPYAQIAPDRLDAYLREEAENCLKKVEMVRSMQEEEHIIRIYGAEIVPIPGGRRLAVLIYMEYLETLRQYLENGKISPENFRKVGIDLCKALEECHKKKIVHRDVKIDNIFIRGEQYVLGDFGLSGYSDGSSSGDIMMGTRVYMAPEVYRSEENTVLSDIYSLGMVLYILYNDSQIPFRPREQRFVMASEYEKAIMRRLNGEELPPPSSSEYQVMMAAAVMTILPVLIVFIFFEKQLVRSITLTGMKS